MKQYKKITFLKKWTCIGLIILIATGIYCTSLKTPFIHDDIDHIVKNPDIKKISNIKTRLIYQFNEKNRYLGAGNAPQRPLTYLTFTLNYHFGQLNTYRYHLFNLLFHILNAILIFFLTRKILFYTYNKNMVSFPLLVSLYFAVHPVNTEVVINVCRRSTSLAAFFYFLAILFFVKTFEKNRKFHIFSLLSFVLSLLSKELAITLPAVILLFDYIFLSNFSLRKVWEKKYYHLFFWIILIFYIGFYYIYILSGILKVDTVFQWKRHLYFATQLHVILRYLKMLIIPTGFSFYHWICDPVKTIFELRVIIPLIVIAGLCMPALVTFKKRNKTSKIIIFFTLWFFITLAPSSSFFPLNMVMAERRVYMPGFSFYFLIVFLCFQLFEVRRHTKKHTWILYGVMGIHISLLGVATYKRNQLYQDPVLLWQDVIAQYPSNPNAYNNLGVLYHRKKDYKKALVAYQKAAEVSESKTVTCIAHSNMGRLYYEQEEYNKALKECRKALNLKPDYGYAYCNLGNVYYALKKYDKAFQEYQKTVELYPNIAEAHERLGILYMKKKEYTKARKEFNKAMDINPYVIEIKYNRR